VSVSDDSKIAGHTRDAHEREVHVDTTEFHDLRLTYAQHVFKAWGAPPIPRDPLAKFAEFAGSRRRPNALSANKDRKVQECPAHA
jgi:hypothetical protein